MSDPTPAELEATSGPGDTVTVEHNGETYLFPGSATAVSGDVIDALDDGKVSHALRALMSNDEWARFKRTRPLAPEYGELLNAFLEAVGMGSLGE